MFKINERIDPKTTMFAHLARLTDEDSKKNKLDNFNLRCINEAYVVGKLGNNKDDIPTFLDIMEDDSFGYLYFKTVSEAEYTLRPTMEKEPFVIHAVPLTNLGIYDILTKEELRNRLSKCGLIFNFMDEDELEKTNVPTLK